MRSNNRLYSARETKSDEGWDAAEWEEPPLGEMDEAGGEGLCDKDCLLSESLAAETPNAGRRTETLGCVMEGEELDAGTP